VGCAAREVGEREEALGALGMEGIITAAWRPPQRPARVGAAVRAAERWRAEVMAAIVVAE